MKTLGPLIVVGAILSLAGTTSAADKVSEVFLRDAIQENLAEIQLGKLAQDNAESDEVKLYGTTLQTDDAALNEQAAKVAERISVAVPTKPTINQTMTYEQMSRLSSKAFDQHLLRVLIAYQTTAMHRFENEAKKTDDPVGKFAAEALVILQKHREAAQRLQSER
jgi:putative membrane protein